jgi:hypothetical protein
MSDLNTSSNQKTERKNVQNSLTKDRKISFSAIWKIAAILKIWEKNFSMFLNCETLYTKCGKK